MATYLLTWNPARWEWDKRDLKRAIQGIRTYGYWSDRWSSGVTKKIMRGDRVFLIKLGKGLCRGIMGSGWVTSMEVYRERHWDEAERKKGKTALYVDVDFDTILDPSVEIFPRALLDTDIYTKQHWDAQASGISIAEDVAAKLEQDWARFLKRSVPSGDASTSRLAEITRASHGSRGVGAGFGTPETNKKVEQSAIAFVTKHYVSQGWKVRSVEAEKRGFDLLCEKDLAVEHAEVKGIKGDAESFIITTREVGQAQVDQHFVLCIVKLAISKHPHLTRYTAEDFVKRFDLAPLVYRASPRM